MCFNFEEPQRKHRACVCSPFIFFVEVCGSYFPCCVILLAGEMSGQMVPADISGHMLDLDENEDLDVFFKVTENRPEAVENLAGFCWI